MSLKRRVLSAAAFVPNPTLQHHAFDDDYSFGILQSDAAVVDAYGMPPDRGQVEFLLELNQLVAEDEAQGCKVRGPGLPDHLDPGDRQWFSTDCIEPPPVGS
jgi:hypothetical protein